MWGSTAVQQWKSVGSSLHRAFSTNNGSANPRPSELVALGLAESRKSYVRGVALSGEPPKLQQPQPLLAAWDRDRAMLPSCAIRCWRAKPGMRHADLLREATAGIAKPASAPLMILQCGTWYECVAVWPCRCVFGGGISDTIGSKSTCKTFPTEFFDWRKPDMGLSQKRPFSTDKSDCKRNDLTLYLFISFCRLSIVVVRCCWRVPINYFSSRIILLLVVLPKCACCRPVWRKKQIGAVSSVSSTRYYFNNKTKPVGGRYC